MRLIISVEGHGDACDAVEEYNALRDYVEGHAMRVSARAVAVGRAMGLGEPQVRELVLTAMLHDGGGVRGRGCAFICGGEVYDGRVGVQSAAERERESDAVLTDEVSVAVRHVHEHWDGSGGPEGLEGVRIPLASRIVLAADAYDVMTARSGCDHESAVRFLERGAGGWFDPEVVRVIIAMAEEELKVGDAVAGAERDVCRPTERRERAHASVDLRLPVAGGAAGVSPASSRRA